MKVTLVNSSEQAAQETESLYITNQKTRKGQKRTLYQVAECWAQFPVVRALNGVDLFKGAAP